MREGGLIERETDGYGSLERVSEKQNYHGSLNGSE